MYPYIYPYIYTHVYMYIYIYNLAHARRAQEEEGSLHSNKQRYVSI